MAIKEFKEEYPKEPLSLILKVANVSSSSYYDWLNWTPNENDELNLELVPWIVEIYKRSNNVRGYQSMAVNINHMLEEQSRKPVSATRVKRIMDKEGLRSVLAKKTPAYVKHYDGHLEKNKLVREFNPPMINVAWVTDFSWMSYNHGKSHVWLSCMMDLYSGEIIGFNLCDNPTAEEAIKTVKLALKNQPGATPLIHADRGSTYTAGAYNQYLVSQGCDQSMSNPGNPYDNAVMESWWSRFKNEWVKIKGKDIESLEEITKWIVEGIIYFNTERRTTKNNGLTPAEMREMSGMAA